MSTQTLARTLHGVGLAAWFGGSLMGAIGLTAAARTLSDPHQRIAVSAAGWSRWRPVNAAAITAYLVGSSALRRITNVPAGRRARRSHVLRVLAGGSAFGAAAYGSVLERKIQHAGRIPVDSTRPRDDTPPAVADAQVTLRALQWAVPALTGALLVGESRRCVDRCGE